MGEDLPLLAALLMVFEDLHWADPTTLELLSLSIDSWRAGYFGKHAITTISLVS